MLLAGSDGKPDDGHANDVADGRYDRAANAVRSHVLVWGNGRHVRGWRGHVPGSVWA